MRISAFIVLLFLVVSCSTVRYVEVPLETVKTEYKYKIERDSVIIKDSIYSYADKDTVYVYKKNTEYIRTYRTDTIVRVDTIPRIVTVTKENSVNKVTKWQKALMWLGGILPLFIVGYIIYKLKQ